LLLPTAPMSFINFRPLGRPRRADRCVAVCGAYRSGSLSYLTAAESDLIVRGLDVRLIIDLRSDSERARAQSPLARHAGVVTLSFPMTTGRDALAAARPGPDAYAEHYWRLLVANAATMGEIVRAVAAGPRGAFLVTCHAGKDRTGVVAACLLSLLGVCERCVAMDYAESGPRLLRSIEYFRESWESRGLSREDYAHRLASPPSVPLRLLRRCRREFGSLTSYLMTAGISSADVEALRCRASVPSKRHGAWPP
jgi:protein-tyrosine phosphatase